ncbi:hypothetical protein CGZ94_04100, partial [Enemella evansiae]
MIGLAVLFAALGAALAVPAPRRLPTAAAAPAGGPAPGANGNCTPLECTARTVDDGPGKDTPNLLRTLTDEQVVPTFFMQGVNIKANPGTVKQVAGTPRLEIGSPTTTHAHLRDHSHDKLQRELPP